MITIVTGFFINVAVYPELAEEFQRKPFYVLGAFGLLLFLAVFIALEN